MATAYPSPPASPRRLDDLLICPVCLEGFKDPKTLVCLHSFCTNCLEHCRRPYRRDITCPVCKKVTPLSPLGISGLQHDFRIQQIKDILLNVGPDPAAEQEKESDLNTKVCDLCKTRQVVSSACHHCIQCYMYFCNGCLDRHNGNPLFSSHHVINMGESNATEVLFCRSHKEHPVRYFCKPCSLMLCTICTMEHDASHNPEPLEKGIIDKYHKELKVSLKAIKSKLSEVKSKTKYLETIKVTHQKALYDAQSAIREKTQTIINKIKDRERDLLQELQNKIDMRMKENGIDSLTEIKFYSSNIQNLYTQIQNVISGSPQQCLVAYEELIAKTKSLADAPHVSPHRTKDSVVRFVPVSEASLNLVIGTLQEVTLEDENEEALASSCPSSPQSGTSTPTSPTPNRKRTASILNALSPNRKCDVKMGKVKAFSSTEMKEPKSPRSKINADEVLRRTSESVARPLSPKLSASASRTSPVNIPGPSSPTIPGPSHGSPLALEGARADAPGPSFASGTSSARLVFKNDQVGGWPGKISTPSSVAILQDGNIVIAECENRIQIFDRNGQSVRIMGWGKVKPQRLTVLSDGRIAITDRNDNCVKIFGLEGELVSTWGAGLFEMPTGIAVMSNGNYVITDTERHTVSIHRPDGSTVLQFGSWGPGDYQFNSPSYVAVDKDDNIIISDSCNSFIKIFDKTGMFLRKFILLSTKQAQVRHPMGIAVANNGNVLVADRDNHRISMFTATGNFVQHVLTKQDGLKYPVDVRVTDDDHVAVVETHSGFLTKDPHHALKFFKFS